MPAGSLAAIEAAVAALPLLPISEHMLPYLDKLEVACSEARERYLSSKAVGKQTNEWTDDGADTGKGRKEDVGHSEHKEGEGQEGLIPLCSTWWKGRRWCDAVAAEALRLTALHRPPSAPSVRFEAPAQLVLAAGTWPTKVEVTGEDSLLAAQRLAKDFGRPLVLNMCHGSWRGGGFLHGAAGQEEELCRRSSIFCELMKAEYPLPAEGVLVTPEVVVFRGQGPTYPELKERFAIAVVTAAAPIGPDVSTEIAAREYEELMTRKIEGLLKACASSGHRCLVLSAWGCGAFRNPPEVVARLFREALSKGPLRGVFQHVVFAILDRWGTEHNKTVFEEEFQQWAE